MDSKKMRKAEVFRVDYETMSFQNVPRVQAHWIKTPFEDLKKGDIFRLWEPDGAPDRVTIDGEHAVCVAFGDAYFSDGVPGIECEHVNGFSPPMKEHHMPTLTFDLTPTTDPDLTCFFCGKQGVDHEFHYRRDDKFRSRQHIGVGVHLKCTTDPNYRPGLVRDGNVVYTSCDQPEPGCMHPNAVHSHDEDYWECPDCKKTLASKEPQR